MPNLLQESFLDEGFILDKRIGVGQPKRLENVKILVANTAMDTDKVKIYGARVRVDSMQKARPASILWFRCCLPSSLR
jgi:T-complex protein 1 subunit beta